MKQTVCGNIEEKIALWHSGRIIEICTYFKYFFPNFMAFISFLPPFFRIISYLCNNIYMYECKMHKEIFTLVCLELRYMLIVAG